MSEAAGPLIVEPVQLESGRPRPERDKTHLITAAAIGAVGVAGALAENRGWVSGWPPPFHSLKHLWLGYYSAWGVSRMKSLSGRQLVATALVAGVAADVGAEMAQTLVGPSHDPFYSADMDRPVVLGGDTNTGNVIDLAICWAGTALFLAQQPGPRAWIKDKLPTRRQPEAT